MCILLSALRRLLVILIIQFIGEVFNLCSQRSIEKFNAASNVWEEFGQMNGYRYQVGQWFRKENTKCLTSHCTIAIGVHPLGLVQVWKIISEPQIIVQKWIFLCMIGILVRMDVIFVNFFALSKVGRKSLNRVCIVCSKQDWSKTIIKNRRILVVK